MAGVVVAVPAAFEVNNAYSFVLNLLLLHSMGFIDYLSWNAPSWSISVEFYTYLVFGLIVLLAQRLRVAALVLRSRAGCWRSEVWSVIVFVSAEEEPRAADRFRHPALLHQLLPGRPDGEGGRAPAAPASGRPCRAPCNLPP